MVGWKEINAYIFSMIKPTSPENHALFFSLDRNIQKTDNEAPYGAKPSHYIC
jgi:hypothetical protein